MLGCGGASVQARVYVGAEVEAVQVHGPARHNALHILLTQDRRAGGGQGQVTNPQGGGAEDPRPEASATFEHGGGSATIWSGRTLDGPRRSGTTSYCELCTQLRHP